MPRKGTRRRRDGTLAWLQVFPATDRPEIIGEISVRKIVIRHREISLLSPPGPPRIPDDNGEYRQDPLGSQAKGRLLFLCKCLRLLVLLRRYESPASAASCSLLLRLHRNGSRFALPIGQTFPDKLYEGARQPFSFSSHQLSGIVMFATLIRFGKMGEQQNTKT